MQVTMTYVDSSSPHLSAQGPSGCLKEPVWGLRLKFPGTEWLSFEEVGPGNELEYCLLGGRSLWVGHQIKGGLILLLAASGQVCNWTEQRADTLTLNKRTWSDCPEIKKFAIAIHIKTLYYQLMMWHIHLNLAHYSDISVCGMVMFLEAAKNEV